MIFTPQVEAVVTKDELQHLAFLCKSEVDSMGRIAAGILRLLKLEGSIGQATIDQLSNLGMLIILLRSNKFPSLVIRGNYYHPPSPYPSRCSLMVTGGLGMSVDSNILDFYCAFVVPQIT